MDVTVRGDERIPRLGLGTGELRGDACFATVSAALSLGYRHLDTAAFYGNEGEVGRAVRASGVPRDELFITTKVWWTDAAADRVYASADASLRRLDTEYVDLLLLHWPAPHVPLAETMTALRRVREAGKARQVGVSNFPSGLLLEAARHAPVFCDQVEYHPLLAQEELLDRANELDLCLTAYSPLAQGAVARAPLMRSLADRYGRSPAQIALRWLVQQPRVAAIPRSTAVPHLVANLKVFDFVLADDDMKAIGELAQRRSVRLSDPEFAPDWTR
ncbi:aldo/keto reductase [Micromonospora sp. M51]|uniref:aldo/keto reductase n=1 Tax=Micromonospora sp. M51 TaxID=2824889 RepID=UPI001B3981E0|nr:aldo/keto reductase [Micromonospora sp. M51]MBQ1010605.1 aldo/keto reductase [Micromonospora sp. M51]